MWFFIPWKSINPTHRINNIEFSRFTLNVYRTFGTVRPQPSPAVVATGRRVLGKAPTRNAPPKAPSKKQFFKYLEYTSIV